MKIPWSDNELDNLLFNEFSKENPDEKTIRKLVAAGANINAVDCNGDSVLINTIHYVRDGLDIRFIQLVVDLGADLNYTSEGFNCLFDAGLSGKPELVELLLKSGASPNCISAETHDSLSDWAEFDQFYEENEGRSDAVAMAEIVQILKSYGARSASELYADKPEQYLVVFAAYPTGLFTAKGNLEVDNIPNTDQSLIKEFKEWLASNPDKLNEYKYKGYKILNPPDINLLTKHNEQGLLLAKRIKGIVGEDIEVKYYSVDPYGFKNKVRNVDSQII